MDNWLDKLKPGDKVIVSGGGVMGSDYIEEVERLTKTMVIVKGSQTRYSRKFGGRIGGSGSWFRSRIREATDEEIKKIMEVNERNDLKLKLSGINWRDKTLEELREVWSVVSKYEDK